MGPFDLVFDVPGVTAAFKRFFEPYCELQILLDHDTGSALLHSGRNNIPWKLLLAVAHEILASPPEDIFALRAALEPSSPPALFEIEIFRASTSATVLTSSAAEKTTPPGLVVLQGDALVTAHYRLGIGVNVAFSSMPLVRDLVLSLMRDAAVAEEEEEEEKEEGNKRSDPNEGLHLTFHRRAREHNNAIAPVVGDMVQRQVDTMFYESQCAAILWAGDVFIPNWSARTFVPLSQSIRPPPPSRGGQQAATRVEFVDTTAGIPCPRFVKSVDRNHREF